MLKDRKEYYHSLSKVPLRIKVKLNTPIVLPVSPIILDGLLAHAVASEIFGDEQDRWQRDDCFVDIPLPLEETEGKYPVWKASAAYSYGSRKEYKDFYVKQPNDEFVPGESSSIVWPAGVISDKPEKSKPAQFRYEEATGPFVSSSGGGFKAYYEDRHTVNAEIWFHAVGNRKEVKRLLETYIHSLGSKRSVGYGEINSISVEEISEDYSLFDQEGNVARILPVEEFSVTQNVRVEACSYRPAYWSTYNMTACFVPVQPLPVWKEKEEEQWDEWDEFQEDWE